MARHNAHFIVYGALVVLGFIYFNRAQPIAAPVAATQVAPTQPRPSLPEYEWRVMRTESLALTPGQRVSFGPIQNRDMEGKNRAWQSQATKYKIEASGTYPVNAGMFSFHEQGIVDNPAISPLDEGWWASAKCRVKEALHSASDCEQMNLFENLIVVQDARHAADGGAVIGAVAAHMLGSNQAGKALVEQSRVDMRLLYYTCVKNCQQQ